MYKWITATLIASLATPCWAILKQAETARPEAPTIWTVTAVDGMNILCWNMAGDAAKYKIYRNGLLLDTVLTDTYLDDDPPSANSYYVIACDDTEQHFSAKSNIVTIDTALEFQTTK